MSLGSMNHAEMTLSGPLSPRSMGSTFKVKHSFDTCVLSNCYVPTALTGTRCRAVNEVGNAPALLWKTNS